MCSSIISKPSDSQRVPKRKSPEFPDENGPKGAKRQCARKPSKTVPKESEELSRAAESKETAQPEKQRAPLLRTAFKRNFPVRLPEGLTLNVKSWSVDDVLKYANFLLPRLPHFDADSDKEAIRRLRIDGQTLYKMATDGCLYFSGEYGVTPRAEVNLKFHCRHFINVFNGWV